MIRNAIVLVTLLSVHFVASAAAAEEALRLGPTGAYYLDPEILSQIHKISFQDERGRIWLADLDSADGTLVSESGHDLLLDTGAVALRQTFQGPEFGLDAAGWAVYYTKRVADSAQIWRASIEQGSVQTEQITLGPARHQTPVISKDPTSPSTRMVYIRGVWEGGTMAWLDLREAATEHDFLRGTRTLVNAPRWIEGSRKFVFVPQEGPERGQVALVDTDSASITTLSDDAGQKSYPFGWFAPELDGELLVLALVDQRSLAIYRDEGRQSWTRISTLEVPESSTMKHIRSPEPFVARGRSYVSVALRSGQAAPWADRRRNTGRSEAEVWILGIDDRPGHRFARRADDGAVGVRRSDPEIYIANDEVFVFYTVYGSEGIELWRAGTGIEP